MVITTMDTIAIFTPITTILISMELALAVMGLELELVSDLNQRY
jgi:hypothetical protein